MTHVGTAFRFVYNIILIFSWWYPDCILILSWFYSDCILILSLLYLDLLWFYPNFIMILLWFYPHHVYRNSLYPCRFYPDFMYSEFSNKHAANFILFYKFFPPTCLIRTCTYIYFREKFPTTLDSGINVALRLLIFWLFSRSDFSSISIRYKWGYAYSFCQIFQGLCLFKGLRLFQTLE